MQLVQGVTGQLSTLVVPDTDGKFSRLKLSQRMKGSRKITHNGLLFLRPRPSKAQGREVSKLNIGIRQGTFVRVEKRHQKLGGGAGP